VRCLIEFFEALKKLWKKFPTFLRLRTRLAPEANQASFEKQLREFVEGCGAQLRIELISTSGSTGRDFHDRRQVFRTGGKNPKRIEVLLTGGIDRYMRSRFETSVIVRR